MVEQFQTGLEESAIVVCAHVVCACKIVIGDHPERTSDACIRFIVSGGLDNKEQAVEPVLRIFTPRHLQIWPSRREETSCPGPLAHKKAQSFHGIALRDEIGRSSLLLHR